ncbi:hypothetical protein PINS_up015854 [Pythium insidiosum]|nr:hypothetical protein PINS_up015854 [Pythium insidiosum]
MRAALLMPSSGLQVRSMGYKLKSKSSVKKRFRVNANGTVKRAQANKRHLATKKNRKRIRRLGQPVLVEGKIRKNIISLLPAASKVSWLLAGGRESSGERERIKRDDDE